LRVTAIAALKEIGKWHSIGKGQISITYYDERRKKKISQNINLL
jgi:hypothetical protein